jgi:hypothetical protein
MQRAACDAAIGLRPPKPDVSTTDQFGTQRPSLTGLDYACVNVSLGGPAPAEAWIVCFNQKTRDALDPPDVWLTTQDLGRFPGMRVDPLDEVCVQATVRPWASRDLHVAAASPWRSPRRLRWPELAPPVPLP